MKYNAFFRHFSLFFAPVAHFFHFLTHLKSSYVFSAIFCDFGSIFGGFGKLLGEIWEALEALGSFFDVIFDQVTTHLKLRISSIEKKEVPREDLEGFADDFGRFLGDAQMHFRLGISSIETDVLWN